MERLVEVTLSKVNILSILDCYYRLFPLIYKSYDPEGITIQRPAGSEESRDERGFWLLRLFPENLLNTMNAKNLWF